MKDCLGNALKKGQIVLIPCFNNYIEEPFFTKYTVKKVNEKSVNLIKVTSMGKLTISNYKRDIVIIKEDPPC